MTSNCKELILVHNKNYKLICIQMKSTNLREYFVAFWKPLSQTLTHMNILALHYHPTQTCEKNDKLSITYFCMYKLKTIDSHKIMNIIYVKIEIID